MTTVSTVNGIAQHFVRFEKLETYHEDIGFLGKGSFGQVRKMRRKDTGRVRLHVLLPDSKTTA